MNSITELKSFLTTQNLSILYTSGEQPKQFESLTTAEGIGRQSTAREFTEHPYRSIWWISYNQYSDDFTFCVGYFTQDGDAVSRETFVQAMPDSLAAKYNETNERRWVRDGTIYRLQLLTNPILKLGILTIVPR